jgi:hypothetical protein
MATEAARFGVAVTPLPIEFKTLAGLRALRQHLAAAQARRGEYPQLGRFLAGGAGLRHASLAAGDRAHAPHLGAGVGQLRQPLALPPGARAWRPPAKACAGTCSTRSASIRRAYRCRPASTRCVFRPADKAAAKAVARPRPATPAPRHRRHAAQLEGPPVPARCLRATGSGPGCAWSSSAKGRCAARSRKRSPRSASASASSLAGQRSDPEHWLQAIDIFCLPSYANEGVPQAILQAMLCALPIVTTPVGAILEAVSDRQTALVVAATGCRRAGTPPSAACSTNPRLPRLGDRSAPCRQRRLFKGSHARSHGSHLPPGPQSP